MYLSTVVLLYKGMCLPLYAKEFFKSFEKLYQFELVYIVKTPSVLLLKIRSVASFS